MAQSVSNIILFITIGQLECEFVYLLPNDRAVFSEPWARVFLRYKMK